MHGTKIKIIKYDIFSRHYKDNLIEHVTLLHEIEVDKL
jgi:hypothetical protein